VIWNRRNDCDHDTKLINSILEETCETWDTEKSDFLAYMIEARMKKRTFPYYQIDKFLDRFGLRKSLTNAVHNRSLLWSPPEEYFVPELWVAEQQKREELESQESKQFLSQNT